MATSHANRGKVAEKKVQDWLKRLNEEVAQFAWLRLPDARSAMGRLAAQPSDFIVFSPAGATFLEVKEIAHDRLLPFGKLPQLADMKKFQLAGCRSTVLVYHTTSKRWRCIDVRDLESISKGSWDLSVFSEHATCEAAFFDRFTL